MSKDLAIVLNNGGLNSAVVTALASQKYRTVMLNVETAPAPGSRARAAYDGQVLHFKPYREHTLAMPFLATLAEIRPAAQPSPDPRRPTPLAPQMLELLPMIAAAARAATIYQANAIFLGLRVGGDSRNSDRPAIGQVSNADALAQATEYLQIWSEMLEHPCGQPELTLESPLLELDPWQVVDLGFQTSAPFEKTWSCMGENAEPCWACPGCRTREAAFQQSGKPDPLRTVKR